MLATFFIDTHDLTRPRLRGNRDHVRRSDQLSGLFLDGLQERGELVGRIEVPLVQRHQDRTTGKNHAAQRRVLRFGQISIENEDDQIRAVRDLCGQFLAVLSSRLVEAWSVDQKNAANFDFVPTLHAAAARFAVQGTDVKCLGTDERIEQGRLAGAHATKHGDMQMTVGEFVQHRLDRRVVFGKRLANAGRQTTVRQQFPEALPR